MSWDARLCFSPEAPQPISSSRWPWPMPIKETLAVRPPLRLGVLGVGGERLGRGSVYFLDLLKMIAMFLIYGSGIRWVHPPIGISHLGHLVM